MISGYTWSVFNQTKVAGMASNLGSSRKGLDVTVADLGVPSPQRRASNKRRLAVSGVANAAALIGPIAKGEDIIGLTNGQFSLIDIIEHVLDCIGPADVAVSTWTMGVYDQEHAASFYVDGRIRSIRWMVDPSMFGRQPGLAGALVKAFGVESFRAVNTHAKFATLVNDEWAVCIRSSMNLNRNERLENFDISESRPLCAFFVDLTDRVFAHADAKSRSRAQEFFQMLLAAYEEDRAQTGVNIYDLKTMAEMGAGLRTMAEAAG